MSVHPSTPIVSVVQPDWMHQIDSIARLFKMSNITGDFTYNQILLVQNDVDHNATVRNIVKTYELDQSVVAATEDLQNINIKTVNGGKENFAEFQNKVEGLKGTDPDPDGWMNTIQQAGDEAKKKNDKLIDDAVTSAKQNISQLPPAGRQPAADVFGQGMGWATNFLQEVFKGIMTIINQVSQILKGIWDKVVGVYNTVKDAATTAIHFIEGLFSGAGYVHFEGSKRSSDVLQAVGHITQNLKKQKIEMDHFSLQKISGGSWILDGKLSSPDNSVDLSKAWKNLVHV